MPEVPLIKMVILVYEYAKLFGAVLNVRWHIHGTPPIHQMNELWCKIISFVKSYMDGGHDTQLLF